MDKVSSTVNQLINLLIFGVGALTLNQWIMLVGLVLSGLTFLTNIYFSHQRNTILKREVEHKINSKIASGECAKCIMD
jgi:hypothetical protein